MHQVKVANEPVLLRAMRQEKEFNAIVAQACGEEQAPSAAHRIIARFENEQRETNSILEAMSDEVMRMLMKQEWDRVHAGGRAMKGEVA